MAKVYVPLVIGIGLLLAAYHLQSLRFDSLPTLVLLIVLGSVSQVTAVTLFGPTAVSLTFPFVFLSLLWFGPGAAILTNAGSVVVFSLFPVRRPLYKAAFNFGSYSFATGAAAGVYQTLGGVIPTEGLLPSLTPVAFAALTYYVANTFTVSLVIALTSDQSPVRVWVLNLQMVVPLLPGLGPGRPSGRHRV